MNGALRAMTLQAAIEHKSSGRNGGATADLHGAVGRGLVSAVGEFSDHDRRARPISTETIVRGPTPSGRA